MAIVGGDKSSLDGSSASSSSSSSVTGSGQQRVVRTKRKLEEAVIDAPQFDAAGARAVGRDALAAASHAQRHESSFMRALSARVTWRARWPRVPLRHRRRSAGSGRHQPVLLESRAQLGLPERQRLRSQWQRASRQASSRPVPSLWRAAIRGRRRPTGQRPQGRRCRGCR